MRIDLIKCILNILQKNHQVALPGLGSLRLVNKGARMESHKIYPPHQSIVFDDKIEDVASFVSYIAENYGLSKANSELILKKFSHRLINGIANYNEVLLPKIGLLKSIGNNSIHFIEDENTINFTKNYLPVLELKELKEIAKSTTITAPLSTSIIIEADVKNVEINQDDISKSEIVTALVLEETEESFFEKHLWPLLALLILIVALIFSLRTCNNETPPVVTNDMEYTLTDSLSDEERIQQELIKEFDTNRIYTEEELSLLPNEIYELGCVIIVGSFNNESNVNNMVKRIDDMDYISFTELNDYGLMRVGILFDCLDRDLVEFIQMIRRDIDKDAWFLQPHLHIEYEY